MGIVMSTTPTAADILSTLIRCDFTADEWRQIAQYAAASEHAAHAKAGYRLRRDITLTCTSCKKRFHPTQEAIDSTRADFAEESEQATDEEIANGFAFCLPCVLPDSTIDDEVRIDVNPSGRAPMRWHLCR